MPYKPQAVRRCSLLIAGVWSWHGMSLQPPQRIEKAMAVHDKEFQARAEAHSHQPGSVIRKKKRRILRANNFSTFKSKSLQFSFLYDMTDTSQYKLIFMSYPVKFLLFANVGQATTK